MVDETEFLYTEEGAYNPLQKLGSAKQVSILSRNASIPSGIETASRLWAATVLLIESASRLLLRLDSNSSFFSRLIISFPQRSNDDVWRDCYASYLQT
jgi:hypothetical protein